MNTKIITLMKVAFRPVLIVLAALLACGLNLKAELNVVSLKPHTPARMGYCMGGPISLIEIVFDRPVEITSDSGVFMYAFFKDKKIWVRIYISDESECIVRGDLLTNYTQGLFRFSLPAGSLREKGNPENTNDLVEWEARFTTSITPPASSLEGAERPYIVPEDLEFTWTGEHLETHPFVDPETGETKTPTALLTEVIPYSTSSMESAYHSLEVYRDYPLKEYFDSVNHVCVYRVDPEKLSECPDTIWLQKNKQYSFKIKNVLDIEQKGRSYVDLEGNEHVYYVTTTEFALPFSGTTEYDETHFFPIHPLKGRLYYYTHPETGKDYVWDIFFEMNVKTGEINRTYPLESSRYIYLHAKKKDVRYQLDCLTSFLDPEDYMFVLFSHDELEGLQEEFSHHYQPQGNPDVLEFDPNEEYELVCGPNEYCTLQGNFIFSDAFSFPLEVRYAASIHDTVTDSRKDLPMYDLYGRRIQEPATGQIYIQGKKKYIGR